MLGRVKLATRPHLRIPPDADVTGIKHHAIIIHKHIFAQHDARAMIALERRVNHRSGRYAWYQVFYRLPVIPVVHGHRPHSGTQRGSTLETLLQLRRSEAIKFPAAHLFHFRLHIFPFCLVLQTQS